MQNSFVTANTFSFSNAVCRQHAALAMHSTGTEELKVISDIARDEAAPVSG